MTEKLLDKWFPNTCLVGELDGVCLQKISAVSRSGKIKGVEPILYGMNFVLEAVKKAMIGNSKKHLCVCRFATSFPQGTALAQS